MKLTKEELITKIQGAEITDDFKMELLEDVSDSFVTVDEDKFIERTKYDELKDKYIKRFTEGAVTEEKPDPKGEEEKKEITYEDLFEKVEEE